MLFSVKGTGIGGQGGVEHDRPHQEVAVFLPGVFVHAEGATPFGDVRLHRLEDSAFGLQAACHFAAVLSAQQIMNPGIVVQHVQLVAILGDEFEKCWHVYQNEMRRSAGAFALAVAPGTRATRTRVSYVCRDCGFAESLAQRLQGPVN